MYHCEQLGKCLPVFNHFCGVLNVPVYLETSKPYLCFLFLLCLDGLFVVGSCVWTWSDKQLRSTAVEGTLLFLVIVNFLHAGLMLAYVGTTMAFHNVVNSERGRGGYFRGTYMAAQEEVPAGVIIRIRCKSSQPWSSLWIARCYYCIILTFLQGSRTIPGISENGTTFVP